VKYKADSKCRGETFACFQTYTVKRSKNSEGRKAGSSYHRSKKALE
jgi:hypothetical protein